MICKIKNTGFLFLLLVGTLTVKAQTIVEIVDDYDNSTSYDISLIKSIEGDDNGNAYIAANNNVLKIPPTGAITHIIDFNGDLSGNNFFAARGLSIDDAENIYVAGRGSNNVFKITQAGVITEIIDETGDGNGNTLSHPQATAVSASGNVYVAGEDSDNVFKIEPSGMITEIIDATGDGVNTFFNPGYITVSADENVYVSSGGNLVFKITAEGVVTTILDATGAGTGDPMSDPRGVVTDSEENLYVVSLYTHRLFKVTPTGIITVVMNDVGDGNGNFCIYPENIAIDNADNLYITGFESNNAFKVTPSGVVTEIIDETGDGNGNTLSWTRDIAVNSVGQVFVSTHFNAFEIDLGVLPVELNGFRGEAKKQANILQWETLSEQNNRGFEVQRLVDRDWEKIGFVEGNGNSFSEKEYSFEDKDQRYGQIYYRLKQIDFSGDFTYSNVISLKNDFSSPLFVYPNPTFGELEIQTREEGIMKIFDSNQVLLRQQKVKGTENINISELPVGVYILSFYTAQDIVTKRIVKN